MAMAVHVFNSFCVSRFKKRNKDLPGLEKICLEPPLLLKLGLEVVLVVPYTNLIVYICQ